MAPRELGSGETISRFIYHARDWSDRSGRAKPAAFDPGNRPEISVAHVDGLTEDQIWSLSRQTLSGKPGREAVLARADLDVAVLLRHSLRAIRDDSPFERHTAVSGWQKENRKAICLELSCSASLRVSEAPVRRLP